MAVFTRDVGRMATFGRRLRPVVVALAFAALPVARADTASSVSTALRAQQESAAEAKAALESIKHFHKSKWPGFVPVKDFARAVEEETWQGGTPGRLARSAEQMLSAELAAAHAAAEYGETGALTVAALHMEASVNTIRKSGDAGEAYMQKALRGSAAATKAEIKDMSARAAVLANKAKKAAKHLERVQRKSGLPEGVYEGMWNTNEAKTERMHDHAQDFGEAAERRVNSYFKEAKTEIKRLGEEDSERAHRRANELASQAAASLLEARYEAESKAATARADGGTGAEQSAGMVARAHGDSAATLPDGVASPTATSQGGVPDVAPWAEQAAGEGAMPGDGTAGEGGVRDAPRAESEGDGSAALGEEENVGVDADDGSEDTVAVAHHTLAAPPADLGSSGNVPVAVFSFVAAIALFATVVGGELYVVDQVRRHQEGLEPLLPVAVTEEIAHGAADTATAPVGE